MPESMRPRLVTAAQNALTAVDSVHPDTWTEEERREELLRAAELLDAAALLLAAAHFATVMPGTRQDEELRAQAEQLTAGRTVLGEVERDTPEAAPRMGGASASSSSSSSSGRA